MHNYITLEVTTFEREGKWVSALAPEGIISRIQPNRVSSVHLLTP